MTIEGFVKAALLTLLKKADRADKQRVRLGYKESIMKPYIDNDPIGVTQAVHHEFNRLEAAGIIQIKWVTPNALIQYADLIDADALAKKLDVNRLSSKFALAKNQVLQHLPENSPHLKAIEADLFNKWQQTGNYEGFTVDDPDSLIQAVCAADAMLNITSEIDERHFSIQVLGDSKKLKGLVGKIAKLHRLRDEEIPEAISHQDVFQLFGVVPIKHPAYLSGEVRLHATQGTASISADFPPCIGVWPDYVDSVSSETDIKMVTSIENQATFMRYLEKEKTKDELVIYTAGIPSPVFRKLYKQIIKAIPDASLRHWGDIDVGGFTILNILVNTAERAVTAYRMTPDHYLGSAVFGALTASESKRLSSLKDRLSDQNRDALQQVIESGFKFEQEAFQNK